MQRNRPHIAAVTIHLEYMFRECRIPYAHRLAVQNWLTLLDIKLAVARHVRGPGGEAMCIALSMLSRKIFLPRRAGNQRPHDTG